jgi:tetratricopeptide (TPR) repeat protein
VALRYQQHKNLKKLLKEFRAILEAKPQVQYVQQYMEYLNGREDKAKLTDFYYEIGYELLTKEKGLYPLAITYLKLGEQISPNDPRILFGLGKAFYNGGDQVQGQQYLNKAYSLNPALRDFN